MNRLRIFYLLMISLIAPAELYAFHKVPEYKADSEIQVLTDSFKKYTNILVSKDHTSRIRSIDFSHDGKLMVSAALDDVIIPWKLPELKPLKPIQTKQDRIGSLVFNPVDSNIFAFACREVDRFGGDYKYLIIIYDLSIRGARYIIEGHKEEINSIDFSPDGKFLISGSNDKKIKLWDMSTGKRLETFSGNQDKINFVIFNPKGKSFAAGSNDNTISIWNINPKKRVASLTGHSLSIIKMMYSHNGDKLYSLSHDNTIRIWNLKSPFMSKIFKSDAEDMESFALSPSGNIIAISNKVWSYNSSSYNHVIKLYETASGRERTLLGNHLSNVNVLSYNNDGQILASGSYDKSIKLWDTSSDLNKFKIAGFEVDWTIGVAERKKPSLIPAFKIIKENTLYDNKILLEMSIQNKGKGAAFQVAASTESDLEQFNNLTFFFGKIKPSETKKRIIPVLISKSSASGVYDTIISFNELNGFSPDKIETRLNITALARPVLIIDYTIKKDTVKIGDAFEILLKVKNIGTKDVDNIKISVPSLPNGLLLRSPWKQIFKTIPKDESISVRIILTRTSSDGSSSNNLIINIQEDLFNTSQDYNIPIPLNKKPRP